MECFRSLCCCGAVVDSGLWETDEHDISTSKELRFFAGARSVQHPLKAGSNSVNADAYVISETMIGVADGVSSVELEGFDPSLLPIELLQKCSGNGKLRSKDRSGYDSESAADLAVVDVRFVESEFPRHVLARACGECTEMGSTTCCLALIDKCKISVVNVGDSQMVQIRRRVSAVPPSGGLCSGSSRPPTSRFASYPADEAALRNGGQPSSSPTSASGGAEGSAKNNEMFHAGFAVLSRTRPQQHFFNCPYQLTRMPDVDCSYLEVLRRTYLVASVTTHEAQPGDIIILGSDGLFDNLYDNEICEIVDQAWRQGDVPDDASSLSCGRPEPANSRRAKTTTTMLPMVSPEALAQRILDAALEAAMPPGLSHTHADGTARTRRAGRYTPFTESASIELGRELEGGKPDDTTVVVAYIHAKDFVGYENAPMQFKSAVSWNENSQSGAGGSTSGAAIAGRSSNGTAACKSQIPKAAAETTASACDPADAGGQPQTPVMRSAGRGNIALPRGFTLEMFDPHRSSKRKNSSTSQHQGGGGSATSVASAGATGPFGRFGDRRSMSDISPKQSEEGTLGRRPKVESADGSMMSSSIEKKAASGSSSRRSRVDSKETRGSPRRSGGESGSSLSAVSLGAAMESPRGETPRERRNDSKKSRSGQGRRRREPEGDRFDALDGRKHQQHPAEILSAT